MRSFDCGCGAVIGVVPPSAHAGYLVWDADVDLSIDRRSELIRSFLEAVRAGERASWLAEFYGENVQTARFAAKDDAEVIEDILSQQDTWTRHVFRCPICGRMYVQRERGSAEFRCYVEG